jgi:[ribosomal protein S5]-alanine N-acetyltransferase
MLQTERLLLRPYTLEDSTLLVQLYNDWNWNDVDDAFAKNFFTEVIQKQYELKGGVLATFLKENNRYIGHCGLKYVADKDEWYLSFRFLKAFWKHNIPSEAAEACLKWGFNRLNLREIVVDLEKRNVGAAKILENVGFKFRQQVEENGILLFRYSIFS